MPNIINYESLDIKNNKIITRHKDSNDWVSTKVIKFFNSFIEIELVQDYLEKIIMLDDILECKFCTTDGSIYVIDSKVYNIKINSRNVVLKINNCQVFQNARDSKRYEVCFYASVSPENETTDYYAILTNISANGFGIITNRRIHEDTILDVSVYFPEFKIAQLKCIIKWIKPLIGNKFRYGLEIQSASALDKARFDDHLQVIQNDRDLFSI